MAPSIALAIANPWILFVGIVVLCFGLFRLHLWFWARRYRFVREYARVLRERAADGGHYELRRLRECEGPPVLLVHGIAANHLSSDAFDGASLARLLAERGFDVWLLTLRSGIFAPWWRVLLGAHRGVRFEPMAQHDVPEAIDLVLHHSEYSRVHYVAHSMGGMLLYAGLSLGTVSESKLGAVAFIGSPVRLVSPIAGLRILAHIPRWLVPRIPLRLYSHALAFVADLFVTPLHRLLANPAHMPRGTSPKAMVNMIEDVPAGLAADFAKWLAGDGELRLHDGTRVVDRLGQLTRPALFIAGAADRIAPPEAVRSACEAWGADRSSTDKRFVLLEEASGFSQASYGHADLLMGVRAQEEVFPLVANHLQGPAALSDALGPDSEDPKSPGMP